MLRLQNKPRTLSFSLCGFNLFKHAGKWYTLHVTGKGYHGLLVDGRSVYTQAKKLGLLLEYENFSK